MSRRRNDLYSKSSILRPDQKKEQMSFQDSTETVNENATSAVLKMKQAVAETTENYLKLIDCDCGPDLYGRVLGPTADEAFLSGLQTIFCICNKIKACDKETEVEIEPERTKTLPKMVSQVLESIGLPPEMVSQIIQTSFAALEEEKPQLANKILQTSTPEMLSQILQTIGLEPEMISQIIQTMSLETVDDKPSVKSGVVQTSPSPSLVSVVVQTDEPETPQPEEKKEEEPKSCVCCECIGKEEEPAPPQKEESKIDTENGKIKCEPMQKLKLCRCYDCSKPIVYKSGKCHHECSHSKSRVRCKCYSNGKHKNGSGTYLALAKGDTWSIVDTTCCCEGERAHFK